MSPRKSFPGLHTGHEASDRENDERSDGNPECVSGNRANDAKSAENSDDGENNGDEK